MGKQFVTIAMSLAISCAGLANSQTGTSSTAVGVNNTSAGTYSTAVGFTNIASAVDADGIPTTTTGTQAQSSTAIGKENTASGFKASAVGYKNHAEAEGAVAFGGSNFAEGVRATAIGVNNVASDFKAVSIGANNQSTFVNAIAVGRGNWATEEGATAIGRANSAHGIHSISFGATNVVTGWQSMGFGHGNRAYGGRGAAFGFHNQAYSNNTTLVGYWNMSSTNQNSVYALGYRNVSSSSVTLGLGHDNGLYALQTVAIGFDNNVSGQRAFVFGKGITNNISDSMMIGPTDGSKVTIRTGGVGIGTTTPEKKLHVIGDVKLQGEVTIAGTLTAVGFSGNGSGFTNLNGANISTGTISDARLSGIVARTNASNSFTAPISSSSTLSFTSAGVVDSLNLNNNNVIGVNLLRFADPGPNEGIEWHGGNWKVWESPDDLTTNGAGNLQFVAGGQRRMTVRTDGTVSVPGSVSTAAVTTATISGGAQGLVLSAGDANQHIVLSTGGTGNVGIGTGNPIERLHVDGNVKVTGNLTIDGMVTVQPRGGIAMGDFN